MQIVIIVIVIIIIIRWRARAASPTRRSIDRMNDLLSVAMMSREG